MNLSQNLLFELLVDLVIFKVKKALKGPKQWYLVIRGFGIHGGIFSGRDLRK